MHSSELLAMSGTDGESVAQSFGLYMQVEEKWWDLYFIINTVSSTMMYFFV